MVSMESFPFLAFSRTGTDVVCILRQCSTRLSRAAPKEHMLYSSAEPKALSAKYSTYSTVDVLNGSLQRECLSLAHVANLPLSITTSRCLLVHQHFTTGQSRCGLPTCIDLMRAGDAAVPIAKSAETNAFRYVLDF